MIARTARTMVVALVMAAPAMAARPALPGWMSGCWAEEKAPNWTEECWSGSRGGIMLGAGRSGRGDVLNSWEAMQIELDGDGKPVFYAQPRGAPRVAFPMASSGDREIVFLNARHDFPQRVRYWREGMDLKAEISLADGSRAIRWAYRRQAR